MLTPKQRKNKQIIIAVSFFLFWGLVGFGASRLFAEGPTCFDGIQNQGEQGIDCGGPCKPCPPILEKIKVLKVEAVRADSQSFDLLARIENPNREYGGSEVSYRFEIFDQENALIKKVEGVTFIFPSQAKYVIETPVNLLASPWKVSFSIQNVNWQRLANFENVGLEIYEKKYTELPPGQAYVSKASGIVQNTSNFDYKKIEIVVVLYDSRENIINFQRTEMLTFYANDKRYFEVSWRKPIYKKVQRFDMEAYTNLFLDETFMKRHGTKEKYQQYY